MIKSNQMKIVELYGSPKERGMIHGETLKPMIEESLERLKHLIYYETHTNPELVIKLFMKKTKFLPAVKKWTPDLLEEIEGIAEGAGVDFDTLFMFQCQDEMVWFSREIFPDTAGHCSAIGCFKEDNSPALLAQNLDWLNDYDGLNAVLRIKHPDSSLETLVPTTAGLIGWCGMNNQPIGVTTNTLYRFLNTSVEGLPVNFIIRAVLEQKSLEDAINFIHKIKHASAENYMIGNNEKVVNFECSANKISQFLPYEGARRIYHTNHPIINDDLIMPPPKLEPTFTTWERYNYLEYRLKNPKKKITIDTIKHILSSHYGPVCVHQDFKPMSVYTVNCIVYLLTTPAELHLTIGPPCCNEFKIFTFN